MFQVLFFLINLLLPVLLSSKHRCLITEDLITNVANWVGAVYQNKSMLPPD